MNAKTALALLVLMGTATPAIAAERTLSVTSFDRIRVDGPFRVKLTTGVAPFARVSGSGTAIDRVSVEVQGRTLVVRGNPSSWGGYPGQGSGPVEVAVGTPGLTAAWLNGAGSLAINSVKGLSFDLALQGSGSVAVGNANVDQLKISISGAGSVAAAGVAPKLTAMVRGTSSFDGASLRVKDVIVGVEGPSVVKVLATNSAKVDARGTSTVEVAGGPACTVKSEGSATVSGCQ